MLYCNNCEVKVSAGKNITVILHVKANKQERLSTCQQNSMSAIINK